MEGFSDPEASAEGAQLALFTFDDMKGKKTNKPDVLLCDGASEEDRRLWTSGCVLAEAQNFARWLMETPSNHMTPTEFVHAVTRKLGQINNKNKIEINARLVSISIH